MNNNDERDYAEEAANRHELENPDQLDSSPVTIIEHEGRRLRVIPVEVHDQQCDVRVASSQGTTPDVLHCHFCGYCYPPISGASRQAATAREADIDLSTEQAIPAPNGFPSVQGMVRADLEVREQLGRQRYGTALQPHNGRDALRDLYEELLDAACYIRQAIEERPRETGEITLLEPLGQAVVEAAVRWRRGEAAPVDWDLQRLRDDLVAAVDAELTARWWPQDHASDVTVDEQEGIARG